MILFLSIISSSLLGFLFWNWNPAKIFLGDAGSIPIGFILGWIIFELSNMDLWHVSILLPMYYFFDSTLTLIFRTIKRERILHAHKKHFYQKASSIYKHSTIVIFISLLNIALISLSIIGTLNVEMKNISIFVGALLTLLTLFMFHKVYERQK